jgi:hypothetical protein
LKFLTLLLLLPLSACAIAKGPDCSGKDSWPASMAFVNLKNAGITTNEKLDFSKTEVTRIASEPLDDGIYQQVHQISFFEKDGKDFDVIAINKASDEECSYSDAEIYLIAKKLAGENK